MFSLQTFGLTLFKSNSRSFLNVGCKYSRNINTIIKNNNYLEKINQTSYFKQRMQFEKVNLSAKRDQLQRSVDQLNGMFESFGKTPVSGSTVTSNDYSDMDKLFMSKEYLLDQINLIDAELLESDKVIFDVFRTVNKSVGFFVPPFIYLPLLFVLLFGIFVNLKNKYKKFTTK